MAAAVARRLVRRPPAVRPEDDPSGAPPSAAPPSAAPPSAAPPSGDARRVAELEQAVTELQAALGALRPELDGHTAWMSDLERGIGDVRDAHGAQLEDVSKWLGSAVITLSSLSSAPVTTSPLLAGAAPAPTRVDEVALLRRELQVWAVRAFLAALPDEHDTKITVVMPTRNRAAFARTAIASVFAQRHRNLELLVVDDGSEDDTPAVIASFDDDRLHALRTTGIGEAAARNLALDAATGEIITFLDDDNIMDPGWLHAVAWAFERWPDTQLLYGARLIEDAPAMKGEPSGALPNLDFHEYDRRKLEQANTIDMNAIAMRAGLEGARFDEQLRSSIDWQLMLVLTAQHRPFELPALACVYRTYAPNRVCDNPRRLEHNRRVRSRVHRTRPMRVLSHNAMFPLVSETYIHEEMLALEANGAEIAFNSVQEPRSPLPVEAPTWHDLDEAVSRFDPDVLVVYWATHAQGELANLERVGRPFALRAHSFDFDLDALRAVQQHPLCVGVFAFPHQASQLEAAHPMVPIFTTHEDLGRAVREHEQQGGRRDLVLSVSAGLPKKNWPLLFDALDRIGDIDPGHIDPGDIDPGGGAHLERGVVLGRSNGFEEVPDEVEALAQQQASPPFVRVNMPRPEVFAHLARTSVLLYTLAEGERIGMPMSIIEALRAGACVVHPDRDELRHVAGPGFRGYRDVDDIVAHVAEVVAGGPAIDAERARNQQWALEQFCAPELGRAFHEQLAQSLEDWRFRVG